ncbi:MAG: HupE/UreJ family protein [Limisphaerales bacterium]
MKRTILTLLLFACGICSALAHEVRPAYLEIQERTTDTYDVLWKVPGLGDQLRLALYVEMPDGSAIVGESRAIFVNNAFIERWTVKREGGLTGGSIRISGLDATLTDALVRIQRLDGSIQVTRLTPSSPSFVVEPAPSLGEVAGTYLKLGVEHILLGYDHLLFLLGLIMLVRGARKVIATVTAFTVAHSITLALATLGVVHVPRPPVEAAIALSIIFVAVEVIRLQHGERNLVVEYPWLVAFLFGLLHGFGFANALMEIGLPQSDVPLALFTFNVGVEFGQLIFICAVFGAAVFLGRFKIPTIARKYARPVAAYGIGSVAAYWFLERLSGFVA